MAVTLKSNEYLTRGSRGDSRETSLDNGQILIDPSGRPVQVLRTEARAPTVNDDVNGTSFKAVPGSTWSDSSTGKYYVCTSNAAGAATWSEIPLTSGTVEEVLTGVRHITNDSITTHATIQDALDASSSGDGVLVGPGSWAESFTIPDGVHVRGDQTSCITKLTGALATGTRVTLGVNSSLTGFQIDMPTDAVPAILQASGGAACVNDVLLIGKGASGIGIQVSSGTVHATDVDFLSGTAATMFYATGGTLSVRMSKIRSVTSLGRFAHAVGGKIGLSTVSMNGFTNTTTLVEAGASGVIVGSGLQLQNATNALRVTDSTARVEVRAMQVSNCTYDLLVDAGQTPYVQIWASHMARNKISYDAACTNVLLQFLDNFEGDEALAIHGELAVGRPQNPKESVFGSGDSYTRGMKVLTTDDTADSSTDGGNLTDVSTSAADPTDNTFTFQGIGAGHAILFGSSLLDASGVALKYWGVKISQTIAAVEIAKRSFIFEIWDGSAWVEVPIMATHGAEFYRYANEVFIRANTSEHIRFGIDNTTTWAAKTIDSSELFWSRIRIISDVTTAPVFQQFKLSPSRVELNADGTITHHGEARYRVDELTMGNVFGESGGVGSASGAVGSGAVPEGWNHPMPNAQLNGNGDAIYFQYTLKKGIDTSKPVFLRFAVSPDSNPEATTVFIASMLPVEIVGITEADPTGGTPPVARTVANTEALTDKVAQYDQETINLAAASKVVVAEFGPFRLDNYYEGDLVAVRLELDDDGAANINVAVWAAQVVSVQWTPGEHL